MNDPKSGQILGNPATTVMTMPGVTNDTILVSLPSGGNDADVFLYFKGSSGNPKISVTDNGTTTNYSRSGSSWSGNHLSDGSYAIYVIHSDSQFNKTVMVLVTYDGSNSFSNRYAGPGANEFYSGTYLSGSTYANIMIGDYAIF